MRAHTLSVLPESTLGCRIWEIVETEKKANLSCAPSRCVLDGRIIILSKRARIKTLTFNSTWYLQRSLILYVSYTNPSEVTVVGQHPAQCH